MESNLIEVRYRNGRRGSVDDVTLNELIVSRKIGTFYRPSQEKWIDIETEPVRMSKSPYRRFYERRERDEEEEAEESKRLEEKPRGLLSRMLRRKGKAEKRVALKKAWTAEDWLQRGFEALHVARDSKGALRAFAKSIEIDPACQRAYLNRGIAYEIVGNLQQAVYDYSEAIELTPGDAKVYYLRGLAHKRLGMNCQAITDLKEAAAMGHRQATDFFKSQGVYI